MAYLRHSIVRPVHLRFWLKTFLYLTTPGGIGYVRKLRKMRDESYVHERDKPAVRHKHHGGGGWNEEKDGDVLKRDYATYDEYIAHQKLKLDEMVKMKGGFSNWDISEFRLKFYQRFKHLREYLPGDAVILCCGARQGTEVEVLRDLGFSNAYGIDLNPGPGNPYVREGDFMKLREADATLDLLYTNCVDHSFDLDAMFAEHARVLKPDGYLLYDMGVDMEEGKGGPFEAVAWDRTEDLVVRLLGAIRKLVRAERDQHFGGQWLWVLLQSKRISQRP